MSHLTHFREARRALGLNVIPKNRALTLKPRFWRAFRILFMVGGMLEMACLDTQSVSIYEPGENSPPTIQVRSVSPQPGQNLVQVLLGSSEDACPPTEFSIPEVSDLDLDDTLYYQWFLDYEVTDALRKNPLKSGTIPPSTPLQRMRTIPTFSLDRDVLISNLGPLNAFTDDTHILELYVADRPYSDPRFTEDNDPLVLPEDGNEDHMYWLIEMLEVSDCGGEE
tara:strand:- start:32 stop:703 length:672 start_codon:yes stop_codon:yes gene_type:complete